MTPRSKLYFKIKHAVKAIATEEGRQYLAMKGLYPFPTTLEKTGDRRPLSSLPGPSFYMIDKKGNVIGTSIPKKPVHSGGIAIVGGVGRELLMRPDGTVFMTHSRIMGLPKSERIFPLRYPQPEGILNERTVVREGFYNWNFPRGLLGGDATIAKINQDE